MRLSRRTFTGGASLLAAGCAVRKTPVTAVAAAPRLGSPLVSPERVIRTTVGLRPFRPGGFVVRAEKLDDKTVIHNYGHGGSGITLSWGSSELAVRLAAQIETRDAAVIGCGVIGLSTARLLQLRGYNPTIYARELPPSTTSNVAGGLWEPTSLFDQARVTASFREQFGEAGRFAFRYFQTLAGERYGVRWLPLYSLSHDGPHQAPPAESPLSEIEPLYPEPKQLSSAENPFGVAYAYRRFSMLIEPSIYLAALMRDYFLSGGRIVVRDFHTTRELTQLKENLIFNCTGLGARTLFEDHELTPIRGQLVFLLPQPEVNYMTIGPGSAYMFPRRDGILLGGSFERNNSNPEPDPALTARILRDNKAVFDAMRA